MAIFTKKSFDSLQGLLLDQIGDLYDAEIRQKDVLQGMAEKATDPQLRTVLEESVAQNSSQLQRVEEVFKHLEHEPERETCDAMKGLISECKDVVEAKGDPDVVDAALIASVQRIMHYEMAGYGACRNYANRLGDEHAAGLLQENLDEIGALDKRLTEIATSTINERAASKA